MKTFNLRQHKHNRQEHSGNFRDLFHNRKSMKIIKKFCIQKLEESIMNNFVHRNKEKNTFLLCNQNHETFASDRKIQY